MLNSLAGLLLYECPSLITHAHDASYPEVGSEQLAMMSVDFVCDVEQVKRLLDKLSVEEVI